MSKEQLVKLFNDLLEIRVNELCKNDGFANILSEDYINSHLTLPDGMDASDFLMTWRYQNITGITSLGCDDDGVPVTVEEILEDGDDAQIMDLISMFPDGINIGVHRSMDFNADGAVDDDDAAEIETAVSGGASDEKYDVNNDGVIDARDVEKVNSEIEVEMTTP